MMNDFSSSSDGIGKIDAQDLEIVSRIEGVRPCVHCGHDLHGQPIRRENTLGLLIAFCPECGRAASLVEHPSLGIWGRRLGLLFMTCIIIVVLGFLVATVMSIFGIVMGLSSEIYSPARQALSELVSKDASGMGGWQISETWWEANSQAALDTIWSTIDYRDKDFLMIGTLFLPVCFMFGVIWSGLLLGLRRRYLPLAGVVICGLSWSIMYIGVLLQRQMTEASFPRNTYQAVELTVLPTVGTVVTIAMLIPLLLGLLFGRSIIRSLVKVALPPRSRGIVRPLWEIDRVPLRIP